jgi:hypothetical protein
MGHINNMGLTYDQLIKLGAKPGTTPATLTPQKTSYTYDELVKMGAKPASTLPTIDSMNQQADVASAQQYGAFSGANTQNPSIIGEASKVVANIAPSAFNFAKGLIDIANPLSTFKKVKDVVAGVKDIAQTAGGYKQAIDLIQQGLPSATYESLVPEAGRATLGAIGGALQGKDVSEQLKTTQRAIVNDPVGQIAPFLLFAKGGFKIMDRPALKVATKIWEEGGKKGPKPTVVKGGYEQKFDTGISKTAQIVTKPVSYAFDKAQGAIGGGTKFAVGQATGLNPETIGQIAKNPEMFTKEAQIKIDRASLGKEVQSVLNKKASTLAETGKAYAPIRESETMIKVSPTWLDNTIQDLTGLEIKKTKVAEPALKRGELPTIQVGEKPYTPGSVKLSSTGSSVLREASDVRAMQHLYDLWKPVFDKGALTANEFLNFRTDLANLSKFERQIGKSHPVENMSKIARARFNEAYRPQLEGLDKLDAEFGARVSEMKRLSKGFVDKEGKLTDPAINRIANATGKGKDLLIGRLEETVPGITQKIKVLKAIEDIQNASGHKVGTYLRIVPAAGGFAAGGLLGAIIGEILTSPQLAVPILRQYGLLKNSAAVNAVVNALKSGGKMVNQSFNQQPAMLKNVFNKDVKEMKIPFGMTIEDVSKKPLAKEISPVVEPMVKSPSTQVESFIKRWTAYDNMLNKGGKNLYTYDRLKNEITPEIYKELSKYKPKEPIELYRFQKKGIETPILSSWSKDKQWVMDMAELPEMEFIKKTFSPNEILVDIEKIPSKTELTDIGEVIVKAKNYRNVSGQPLADVSKKPIKVIRYSQKGFENTDTFRGGTWYSTPESKTFDFEKGYSKQAGGPIKTETNLEVKNPLTIPKSEIEAGSGAVIENGYEKWLPPKERRLANELEEKKFEFETNEDTIETIERILGENGNTPKQIHDVIRSTNKVDSAMDLIISKGLKKEGYDALILENEYKGNVIDRHIFKFADESSKPTAFTPKATQPLAKEISPLVFNKPYSK